MRKEDFEELIGLYLSKELKAEDRQKIREDLIAEGFSESELDDLLMISESLEELDKVESSSEMDKNFYKWLGGQKTSSQFRTISLRFLAGPTGRITAGIALFILGWLGSSILGPSSANQTELAELNAEVTGLRQNLFLTTMQQSSSVERIQAVNGLADTEEVDGAIIQSLLKVLSSDQNNNVRLASLESLLQYTESPTVREGLVRSISLQNSPLLQLRLAEVMMKLQETGAIPELRKVLQQADLNYSVRTKYDETVQNLASL